MLSTEEVELKLKPIRPLMAQSSSASDLDFVDDFYFSALCDEAEESIFPLSGEKCAEEIQFQEALMLSTIASRTGNDPSSASCSSPGANQEKSPSTPAVRESSLNFCEICVERKETDQMFKTQKCPHSFCSECITKHVMTRVQESVTIVTCPGIDCKSVLEPDNCRHVLPQIVLNRWEDALCEELINVNQRFYCPFKDCSAMLVNDNEGGEVIRESECPYCHRLFCAQCHVTWHPGIGCEEFQRLNEEERGREDLMVRELAAEKKWGRCPQCKFYVERTEGCPHITCRCKFQFCYGCGEAWNESHGGCKRNE